MTWEEIFFLKGISLAAEAREWDANSKALKQKPGRARADPTAVVRVSEMTPKAVAVGTSRSVSQDKPPGPPQSLLAFSLPGARLYQKTIKRQLFVILSEAKNLSF